VVVVLLVVVAAVVLELVVVVLPLTALVLLLLLVEFVDVVLVCVWSLSVPFVCDEVDTCWLKVCAVVADALTAAEAVATFARVAAAEVPGLLFDELTEDDEEPARPLDCVAAPFAELPPIK
jgi:hypothetical protein